MIDGSLLIDQINYEPADVVEEVIQLIRFQTIQRNVQIETSYKNKGRKVEQER